jgi:hypothetical protein
VLRRGRVKESEPEVDPARIGQLHRREQEMAIGVGALPGRRPLVGEGEAHLIVGDLRDQLPQPLTQRAGALAFHGRWIGEAQRAPMDFHGGRRERVRRLLPVAPGERCDGTLDRDQPFRKLLVARRAEQVLDADLVDPDAP